MNFLEHQRAIRKLLHTPGVKPLSGCYIYSRDENDDTVKIGMSEAGLYDRIKGAKSCYPFSNEFWLHFVIISLDGQKGDNGTTSSTRYIENELLTQSKHLSTIEMEAGKAKHKGRPKEYRLIGKSLNLHKLIQDTLNKFRTKWDYLIVFDRNSWNITRNFKTVKKPIANIEVLSYAGEDMDQRVEDADPSVHVPKNAKVGDKIPSPNWPTFTIREILPKKQYMVNFHRDKRLYRIHL